MCTRRFPLQQLTEHALSLQIEKFGEMAPMGRAGRCPLLGCIFVRQSHTVSVPLCAGMPREYGPPAVFLADNTQSSYITGVPEYLHRSTGLNAGMPGQAGPMCCLAQPRRAGTDVAGLGFESW